MQVSKTVLTSKKEKSTFKKPCTKIKQKKKGFEVYTIVSVKENVARSWTCPAAQVTQDNKSLMLYKIGICIPNCESQHPARYRRRLIRACTEPYSIMMRALVLLAGWLSMLYNNGDDCCLVGTELTHRNKQEQMTLISTEKSFLIGQKPTTRLLSEPLLAVRRRLESAC